MTYYRLVKDGKAITFKGGQFHFEIEMAREACRKAARYGFSGAVLEKVTAREIDGPEVDDDMR